MVEAVHETDFSNIKLLKRGKVRDIYDLGDKLLMVATDRMSAFDVVMTEPIPEKGKILTQISLFWFDIIKPLIQNHVISSDVRDYPSDCRQYSDILDKRSMLVKKTEASSCRMRCKRLSVRFRMGILSENRGDMRSEAS